MESFNSTFIYSSFPLPTEEQLSLLLVIFGLLYIFVKFEKQKKNYPPGPVGLPIIGYLPFLGSEPHKTLLKLGKEKYGDIIGVQLGNKYTIVLNEWNVVKETLTHPGALDRDKNLLDHIPGAGFASANGKEWLEQRRYCVSSVRDLGVGRGPWETIILDEVQSFLNYLQKSKGEPLEISHKLNASITSNIISFLIGRRLKTEEEPEKVQLAVDFSDVSFTYTGPSNATTVIPWLRKYFEMFKIAGYDRAATIMRQFCEFVKEEISRHKISPEYKDVNDFINSYLSKISNMSFSHDKGEHYFSESNLKGNLNILFLAASDTIFSSIGWILRLMAEHKDVQQKVYDELMEVLGKGGIARYEERNKIPYTFAVMMESQRFSSIVPLSTTRKANQDFKIRGYTIPRGSDIVANLWALHNDSNYWNEPEKFLPERFLLNGETTIIKLPQSYAPFSIGRRNCPGETTAWMEILSYFTEIIKRFEISAPPNVKPDFNIVNGLVAHLSPQALCFKEREYTM